MSEPKLKVFLQLPSEVLYPLIVLAGFAFFVSLVPLPPNDFWWHLKIGEIISTTHQIPTTNMFSWTLPADQAFTYGAWLGELLLYFVYQFGTLNWVTFIRTALITLSFFWIAAEARRKSGSWRIAAFGIAIAALMTVNNLVIRPQIWAWLPFVCFLVILGRFADGAIKPFWLLVLPLVMMFWVNVHGSFILGGILVGIFFSGETIETVLRRQVVTARKKIAWLFFTGVLCGIAMLFNPRGFGSISYLIALLTDKPSQNLIMEWQSPTPNGIANTSFFVSILILFGVSVYSLKKFRVTEFLLIMSFTWLAWSGMRYIVWYGLVLVPILSRQISGLALPKLPLISQTNFLNTILAAVIFLPAALAQPWTVNHLPLPQKYWEKVWLNNSEGPLIAVETPLKAVEYLKSHPGGKYFNEMGYGSYLIWAAPNQKVFIDPRVELYPLSQWEDYIQIQNGVHYNELLAKYGADRILLDKKIQPDLARELSRDSTWIIEYSDNQAEIWFKK